MAAEVRGLDLSAELRNQARELIHQAFLDYQIIFFRGQTLDAAKQVEIASIFGKPAVYPSLAGVEGVPEAHDLIKTADDLINFGGIWHSDTSYKPAPDMGTALYACEVPDAGGDTLFANTYLAFDALSDGMKAMLERLVAVNDSYKLYPGGRSKHISKLSAMKDAYNDGSEAMQSEHPVIRMHPDTGRKSLYVNTAHTLRFKDMTVDESKPLIDFLSEHSVRPEFTCRLRWQNGAVAIWDNRCTQHFAVNDYPDEYRRMRWVTFEGDWRQ